MKEFCLKCFFPTSCALAFTIIIPIESIFGLAEYKQLPERTCKLKLILELILGGSRGRLMEEHFLLAVLTPI